jgi:hypothetical protein
LDRSCCRRSERSWLAIEQGNERTIRIHLHLFADMPEKAYLASASGWSCGFLGKLFSISVKDGKWGRRGGADFAECVIKLPGIEMVMIHCNIMRVSPHIGAIRGLGSLHEPRVCI